MVVVTMIKQKQLLCGNRSDRGISAYVNYTRKSYKVIYMVAAFNTSKVTENYASNLENFS